MGNIMIVEDDLLISNGIKSIIKSIDLRQNVIATAYSKNALEYAKKNHIDVFILDIQLKDYSGVKLAEELRLLAKYQITPMIFVTALMTKELEAFRKVNCYEFIIKPFSKDELKEVLEMVVNKDFENYSNDDNTLLKIKQKEFTHTIAKKDIVYIELRNRKLIIRTINEELVFALSSLKNIQDDIEGSFIRCHKYFLINSKMVEKFDPKGSKIRFKTIDEVVPFSRSYREILSGLWL